MEKIIDDYLINNKETIFKEFEELININSFTSNIDGVIKAKDCLLDIASKLGIEFETIYSSKKERPHLIYGKEKLDNYYAFVGHFDTVHAPTSDFNKLVDLGDTFAGPGTNDMKSGLIVALHSVHILKKLYPNENLPIKILFNSDEETGSSDSRAIIEEELKNAKAGFIFEPGRSKGQIVTSRKAVGTLDIEVFGKAAHSGVEPWNGINALLVSCEIIQKLDKLNDYENGIIVGCNMIDSGVARNVVSAYSKITVDIRFAKMDQEKILYDKIRNILDSKNSQGATIKYDLFVNRPPLERSEKSAKLADIYIQTSLEQGIACEELSTGGGSDGNFVSAMGIPVLDGLGAVGNFSHTIKEYTVKESLLYRTKIFVLFMSKLLENKGK